MAGVAVAVEGDRLEAPAVGLRLVAGEAGALDVVERQPLHHLAHVVDVGKSQRRAVGGLLGGEVELRMVAQGREVAAAAALVGHPRDLGVAPLVLDVTGEAGLLVVARHHPAEVVGAVDVVGGVGEGAEAVAELLVAGGAALVGDPPRAALVTDAAVVAEHRVIGRQRSLARPAAGGEELAVEHPAEDEERRDAAGDEHRLPRQRRRVVAGDRQVDTGEDPLVLALPQ